MILTRKWTANDLGQCPACIHAAAGLSPYAMVDVSEDDVALMQQDHDDQASVSSVSTSEFRAARAKLISKTPNNAEGFMLMLKRLSNLLFALFGGASPLYKQMKGITDVFHEYSPNAQSKLTLDVKSAILCIILLQARCFAQGKMTGDTPCLGEFIHMVNLVKTKSCEMILHIEVPTELLRPSKKWPGAATKTVDTTSMTVTDADPWKRGEAHAKSSPTAKIWRSSLTSPWRMQITPVSTAFASTALSLRMPSYLTWAGMIVSNSFWQDIASTANSANSITKLQPKKKGLESLPNLNVSWKILVGSKVISKSRFILY